MNLLIQKGANVNAVSTLNSTALINAAKIGTISTIVIISFKSFKSFDAPGNDEIVQMLLRSGADPEIKDADGKSAKDFAAERGIVSLNMNLIPAKFNKKYFLCLRIFEY